MKLCQRPHEPAALRSHCAVVPSTSPGGERSEINVQLARSQAAGDICMSSHTVAGGESGAAAAAAAAARVRLLHLDGSAPRMRSR